MHKWNWPQQLQIMYTKEECMLNQTKHKYYWMLYKDWLFHTTERSWDQNIKLQRSITCKMWEARWGDMTHCQTARQQPSSKVKSSSFGLSFKFVWKHFTPGSNNPHSAFHTKGCSCTSQLSEKQQKGQEFPCDDKTHAVNHCCCSLYDQVRS